MRVLGPGCVTLTCRSMNLPRRIVAGLVAVVACACFAQTEKPEPSSPKTKLQAFEALTGAVIIKGYTEVGSVAGMGQLTVSAKEFTNAADGKVQYGITVGVTGGGQFERESTSFIDYDEIDSLLTGIDYVKAINKSVTKLHGFEAIYRTRDDLTVTVFSGSDEKIQAAVTSGRFSGATAFISLEKLASFRALIVEAKKTLDGVKK